MADDGRRYQILGVLGQGGFGRVYRARLQGPQGFVKDVAIKLLNDPDAPESVLRRFRDESRILGLIRDRAVINVDPPTRLEGRWAVVMEFVDGETLKALLRRHGPLPPSICLQVVQEIARALDKMYTSKGPDGQPLRVIHRDLKPGNIQLTPSGDLKILDFGIAWARFEMREADTTVGIGGTPGYIAPERLAGVDTAAADIFSLGVVLRKLLTGVPAKHLRSERERTKTIKDPTLRSALELSDAMTSDGYETRPSARDVEGRAGELIATMGGPRLREWCETKVDMLTGHTQDDLIGTVLTETLDGVTSTVVGGRGILDGGQSRQMVMTGVLSGVFTSAVLVALLLIVVGAAFMSGALDLGSQATSDASAVAAVPAEASEGEAAGPSAVAPTDHEPAAVEPDADTLAVDVDAGDDSSGVDEAEAAPVAVAPRVRRQAAKPKPTPEPTELLPVVITSFPMGVDVAIDGKAMGKTPLIGVELAVGNRTLKMVMGEDSIEEPITVGKHSPTRFVWRVGEGLERSY